MLFVPNQFVVAILLLVLFASVVRRDDEARPNVPFLALILLGAVLSLLTGLRWGYGVKGVIYIAPVVAASVAPLAYLGVSSLVGSHARSRGARLGLHAIPSVAIVVLLLTWHAVIDLALVTIFVAYAVAILLLIRRGPDALRLAPFEGAGPAYRAIVFAAFALLLSAAVDTFVFLDLEWFDGAHALTVISMANVAALAILAVAAAYASRSHAPVEVASVEEVAATGARPVEADEAPSAEGPVDATEDAATLAAVQALMDGKLIYRDVDLNLNRLARKLGIPTRKISAAINREKGQNVSQYVNSYRIAEACHLLAGTQKAVTEIMFEVGFQTKSNFNREFRRVTDMTPLEWRERKAPRT